MRYLLPRAWNIFVFFAIYFRDVVISTVRIALDVMTPGLKIDPQIKEFSTERYAHYTTLLFANLVSFTPGTLTIQYDQEKHVLMIHFLYRSDIPVFETHFIPLFDRAFHRSSPQASPKDQGAK